MKKNYLYFKDHLNPSLNCLLMKEKKVWIKKLKNQKTIIDYSQTIDDVYENLEEYNPAKKRKVLIVVDDMIIDRKTNSHYNSLVTELFKSAQDCKTKCD